MVALGFLLYNFWFESYGWKPLKVHLDTAYFAESTVVK